MKDTLIRGVVAGGLVRGIAVVTTNLVEEARVRHKATPTAAAALGRVLTAAALLTSGLKEKDTVTVRVLGDGPLGALVAAADAHGNIRGYVQNPEADVTPAGPGKLDVGKAVGKNGYLYVTKDMGLKEPYTGSVALVSGEIGEDLAAFFMRSEQIPSAVNMGILVNPDCSIQGGGGYLIQLMPGSTDEQATAIEDIIRRMQPVSTLISTGWTPQQILKEILGDMEFTVLEEKEIRFRCTCSKERLEGVLTSLGKEELESIIQEQGSAEAQCHFCREVFWFERHELEKLRDEAAALAR